MLPSDDPDYDYDDGNKPAFSFDNDTKMNLDGPGYALSLLLIGEIVILAMAFFVGGLGFGGRSFSSSTRVSCSTIYLSSILINCIGIEAIRKYGLRSIQLKFFV